MFWAEGQTVDRHVLDGLGVIFKNAEVVYGIAVDRVAIDFLVVVEDDISRKWAGADNMSVGDDQASLGIDNEASGLAGTGGIGIEGAGLAEADGDGCESETIPFLKVLLKM